MMGRFAPASGKIPKVTEPVFSRIEAVAEEISPVLRDTPQFVGEQLGEVLDVRPVLKVETINPVRCAHGRGADVLTGRADPAEVLTCADTGNLGRALALSGRRRGVRVEIFASRDDSPLRLFELESLGAVVRLVDGGADAARRHARECSADQGRRFVDNGSEPALTEGAGTIGVELAREPWPVDVLLLPVGDGSMVRGIAAWLRAASPETRLLSVGPEGNAAPGALASALVEGPAASTPGSGAGCSVKDVVDGHVEVGDDVLRAAVELLLRRCGLVADPAGAAGVVATLLLRDELRGATVALPVLSANPAPGLLNSLL